MSLRLGETKIKGVNLPSFDFIKAFFDAGGKCGKSKAKTFEGAISFEATSDVTDMENMFYICQYLESVPLFDTSKVTVMINMFDECKSLKSVPLFNTINVTNMTYMFHGCINLKSVPLFNTSKVTNMNSMFSGCINLINVPLFDTSNVTRISNMFYECSKLTSIPAFDISKVTESYYTFDRCTKLETIHMKNIGTNLNISASTLFTREALLEIIGNLKTVTETKTLTMGATNLAKLTEEDKAIATNKGWTLA